jgi:hypothetical protein
MRILRDNGLTIVLTALTLASIAGMLIAGRNVLDHELADHGASQLALAEYAKPGHFLSSLFENWESEFLQMSAYVMLTAFPFSEALPSPRIRTSRLNRTKSPNLSRATRPHGPSASAALRGGYIPTH